MAPASKDMIKAVVFGKFASAAQVMRTSVENRFLVFHNLRKSQGNQLIWNVIE